MNFTYQMCLLPILMATISVIEPAEARKNKTSTLYSKNAYLSQGIVSHIVVLCSLWQSHQCTVVWKGSNSLEQFTQAN